MEWGRFFLSVQAAWALAGWPMTTWALAGCRPKIFLSLSAYAYLDHLLDYISWIIVKE
jgi:hypothetical protein